MMFVTGCATSSGVSHHLEFCCGANGPPLATYDLALENVPGFLAPYLSDELEAALLAKGMQRATQDPAAHVTLTYSEIYPDSTEPLVNDGFSDPMLSTRPRRFIARVTLQIRRVDGAEVLRGTLSRPHTVSVGDYMHQRARVPIYAGFVELLKRLPQQP